MKIFSGEKLRQARETLNLSLNDLYYLSIKNDLPITRQSISHWENGTRTPNSRYLPILAKLLERPIEYFFDFEYYQSSMGANLPSEVPSGPVRNDLPKRVSKEGGR